MGTRPGNPGDITIAPMTPDDWPSVRRIYSDGIATGNATFETEPPDWDAWNRNHHQQCRLVARIGDEIDTPAPQTVIPAKAGIHVPACPIVAWAALSPVSARACYAGVAEHSIYVDEAYRGRGIGKTLLTELVRQSEAAGFWTLQSSIFPENQASIAIHLACGFRILGRRKRVAMLNGIWRDTVIVERRSPVAGG